MVDYYIPIKHREEVYKIDFTLPHPSEYGYTEEDNIEFEWWCSIISDNVYDINLIYELK